MSAKACAVEGCERPVKARGWCGLHYHRWERNGDPLEVRTIRVGADATPVERLLSKINTEGSAPEFAPELGPCWEWLGAKQSLGYGSFMIERGRRTTAHRAAYLLLKGPVPKGWHVDHLCRNTSCVNPDHMEPVTHAENMRRGLCGDLTTHCPKGHEYTEDNTIRRPSRSGGVSRSCRECQRIWQAAAYQRRKERKASS